MRLAPQGQTLVCLGDSIPNRGGDGVTSILVCLLGQSEEDLGVEFWMMVLSNIQRQCSKEMDLRGEEGRERVNTSWVGQRHIYY